MLRVEITRAHLVALIAIVGMYTGLASYGGNSTTPTKPFTFSAGQVILSGSINSDFDTLYTELQGNVGTANLLNSCITTAKIVDLNVTEGKLAAAVVEKLVPTGTMVDYVGTTAPTGYVLADGKTIGDATSGATVSGGGSAGQQALFELLYNSMADAEAPVSGGRSGNATTDFNAHKTIALPDLRGRIAAGDDNMGGSTANRITVAGGNYDGTVLGKAGGAQNHALTPAQLAAHTHTITDPGHNHTQNSHNHTQNSHTHSFTEQGNLYHSIASSAAADAVAYSPTARTTGGTVATNIAATATNIANDTGITATNSSGSGSAHPNVQPTITLNKIIKL